MYVKIEKAILEKLVVYLDNTNLPHQDVKGIIKDLQTSQDLQTAKTTVE